MKQEKRLLDGLVDYLVDKLGPVISKTQSKRKEEGLFFALPYCVRFTLLFLACFVLIAACILVNFYGVILSLLFLSFWGKEYPSLGLTGEAKNLYAEMYVVLFTAFILFFMVLALQRKVGSYFGLSEKRDNLTAQIHQDGSAVILLFKVLEMSLDFLEKPRIIFHLVVFAISLVVLLLV